MGDEARQPVLVRVLPPYDVDFPGVYELGQTPDQAGLAIVAEVPPPTETPPVDTPSIWVRVLPPFNMIFPDIYQVEEISETGAWKIAGGCDFDPSNLELVP